MGEEYTSVSSCRWFIYVALLLSLISAVLAVEDSDADGVLDSSDVCPQTNYEEGLPILERNREFLGCSCSQIYEMKGEYCYDIFCATDRPFLIRERTYSSRQSACPADYCTETELHDFPDNREIACVNGKEANYTCTERIVTNAQECINGSIASENEKDEKKENELDILLLDDYEKLQRRAYLISQNNELQTILGISGNEIFLQQSEKSMNAIRIEKSVKVETKTISSTGKSISLKTVTIYPEKHKSLRDVFIFEEMSREDNIKASEIVAGDEVFYKETQQPLVLVWHFDKISKPVEVTYQVNKPLEGESNTLVIAKEIKNSFWKFMLIPIAFIAVIAWIFIKTSEKSVPKAKKIFKD